MPKPDESLAALLQDHAEADAAFGAVASDKLADVTALANQLVSAKEMVNQAEAVVRECKERFRKVAEDLLPAAMDAAGGLKELTLDDGSKITVKEDVHVSVKADKKDDTYAWLDQNGHGAIVKRAVVTEFGRGSQEEVHQLAELLEENGYAYTDQQSVHAGTLKSWAREELANGHTLPDELFWVHQANVATVKLPKK